MTCNTPGYCRPLSEPVGAITTAGHKALITPMLAEFYGNGKCHSIDKPLGTITTKDRNALVTPIKWVDYNYGSERTGYSIDGPLRTITGVPKAGIISAWLVNHQYQNKGGSIHKPCPTIIAAQKSYPLSIAVAKYQGLPIVAREEDSEVMKELKALCASIGVQDIFLRMLKVDELKRIQGFPSNYYLAGNPEQQKKFIGNAVVPAVVKAWFASYN